MEFMPEFSLLKPETAAEAAEMWAANPGAKYLAGGTDLVVNIRRGIETPATVIDLNNVAEMQGVSTSGDGLRLGAAVTLADLADNAQIKSDYRGVAQAASAVAASSHRNVATLGGNLCLDTRCVFYNQSEWWRKSNDYCLKHRGTVCHVAPSGEHCFAAFSGDVAPALVALGATVELVGPDGARDVPLKDIYEDDGRAHLLLKDGEILVAVLVPQAQGATQGYSKARVRGAVDFPLAGVAISLTRDGQNLASLTVALTGTNSKPLLVEGTDAFVGQPLDDDSLEKLVKLLPKQIQPMTSTFTPPGYRRKVIANLTRTLARKLYEEAA